MEGRIFTESLGTLISVMQDMRLCFERTSLAAGSRLMICSMTARD